MEERSGVLALTVRDNKTGVGVVFRAAKNGSGDLRVVAVAPDGPARESGLQFLCSTPSSLQAMNYRHRRD